MSQSHGLILAAHATVACTVTEGAVVVIIMAAVTVVVTVTEAAVTEVTAVTEVPLGAMLPVLLVTQVAVTAAAVMEVAVTEVAVTEVAVTALQGGLHLAALSFEACLFKYVYCMCACKVLLRTTVQ
jgi:hypothetical protein